MRVVGKKRFCFEKYAEAGQVSAGCFGVKKRLRPFVIEQKYILQIF